MKVLLVDGSPKRASFHAHALRAEGLTSDVATTADDAERSISREHYDLVLLDGEHAEIDASKFTGKAVEKEPGLPVLVLVPDLAPETRVACLDAGASGCLTQPFALEELFARIFALLRRARGTLELRCGELEIDRAKRTVLLSGKPLRVGAREYALLLHLMLSAEHVVSREVLLSQVWNDKVGCTSNLVDAQISRLRQKLSPHGWMLETVRGRGYRLTAQRAA